MESFSVNCLFIIESLDDEEIKTGVELFNYLKPICDDLSSAPSIAIGKCEGVIEFRGLLNFILNEAKRSLLPLIHIECHATAKDGLLFRNGSELSWTELCDLLRPINQACKFQLFVVVSSCYGYSIVDGIEFNKGAPCLALIGPSDEVDPSELLGHFRDFYRIFLQTTNIPAALRTWNARKLDRGRMLMVKAETWWRNLMFIYLEQHVTSDSIERFARYSRKLFAAQGDIQSLGSFKRKFRRELPRVIDEAFNVFFMVESKPENAVNFSKLRLEIKAAAHAKLKIARI